VAFTEYALPATTPPSQALALIHTLNQDPLVHGILLQLPLPSHLSAHLLLQAIDPAKDVDGLHDLNMGRLWNGSPLFVPCTPKGCMYLLRLYVPSLEGKKAVVLGRSQIVGRPMAHLLTRANCTVTVGHSHTQNVEEICQDADILVSAMGQPHLIKGSWVKKGAVVLDVGISRFVDSQGKVILRGDVDFTHVAPRVSAITPVPGGVGPMTIASLLENCLQAAQSFDA
jgi:methylenetetrahydrofolate dehydrogenase (NADP+)/methenyltetrahydrofolate cyclohydrolase